MIQREVEVEGYEVGVEKALPIRQSLVVLEVDGSEVLLLHAFEAEALADTLRAVVEAEQDDDDPLVEVRPVEPQWVPRSARVPMLEQYIAAEVPVLIDYVDQDGEESRRHVSPYEIREISDGTWLAPPKYLVGWCHKVEAFRNFRIARIQGIAPSPVEYRQPE